MIYETIVKAKGIIIVKVFKWSIVLLCLSLPLGRFLQDFILQEQVAEFDDSNLCTAICMFVSLWMSIILGYLFYILEVAIKSTDGKKVIKIENSICGIILLIALLLYLFLRFNHVPLFYHW